MKTFTRIAAQGEITLIRIGDVTGTAPEGYTPLATEGGNLVIGHSETGHHHVMEPTTAKAFVADKAPEGLRILRLIVEQPTVLEHLRGHDTHEPLMVPPGEYDVRIAREHDPYANIARRVAD
jgi:hypothetical protein